MKLQHFRRYLRPLLAVLIYLGGPPAHGQKEPATDKIAEWRKGAGQGDAKAQYNLGLCYVTGKGVAKDYTEAAKWFSKAAEQGNVKAQVYLGVCCFAGEGVPKDFAGAVKWFRKAAEQGNAIAQMNLAAFAGAGVGVNDVEAYKWTLVAAAQGMELAKNKIPQLERYLSPTQRNEGQRLATEWQTQF